MRLQLVLNAALERLTGAEVPSPRLNAETLLMFVLGCDRAYLHAHPERELTAEEISRYDAALARRSSGVPAQYITGHQEFWALDFIVTPAVLIPRPETEHVIETVLELSRRAGAPAPHGQSIVDVGTGSGCIAIALARESTQATVQAVDISVEALEIARANAARLGANVAFKASDLLTGFPAGQFDFVVSNPPYVGESETDEVQLEVRKFEPRSAVFAGPTGLEVIERLVPQAKEVLKPGGWLVMEISGSIGDGVAKLLNGWKEVEFVKDLQGIRRVVKARKPK